METCRGRSGGRVVAGAGVALVVALLVALGSLAAPQAPHALAAAAHPSHAQGGSVFLTWGSSMIYAGQNNGNPEGPVGELASVSGTGFTPGVGVNLVLAPGDSASDPTVCQSGSAVTLGTGITVQNDGTFTFSFTWPNSANSGDYSVCALNPSDNSVITGADGGPFHVLSANQPAIQVAPTTVPAGQSVTITGSSWLPPQPITVFLATCHNCNASPFVSATPTSDSSGAFSVQLTIPAGVSPGQYVASAFTTNNDVLDVGLTGGSVQLTISATVAPTPTPTIQVSTTPSTQATTQATTATGGAGGGGATTSGDNTPYIIAVVVAVVILLLALAGLFTYLIVRRRRGGPAGATATPTPYPPTPPGGSAGYATPASRPGGTTGANTPPDWRILPNWNSDPTQMMPGGVPSGPTPPAAPAGWGGSQAPQTQSTQPVQPSADGDAPTARGNYPD